MGRRPAKPATPAYLERVALWYIERYPATRARVTRVLRDRVRRSVDEHGTDLDEGLAAAAAIVERLADLGYLDDARFATQRLRGLRGRGRSSRAIRATLSSQGVASEHIDEALANEPDPNAELEAARALVRRRRLGPHRAPEDREARREKDLAVLARAGFRFEIAQRALESDDPDR